MFWTSWTLSSFAAGLLPPLLLSGSLPVFSFQEPGPQPNWKTAATQNQYLQEFFRKEYWLARREGEPEAIKDLSSREPYERQYPREEVPSLQRTGRSRGQRPEGRTRDAESFVEKEISRLIHQVDRHLLAIGDSFAAAMAAAENPGRRKPLRNSLKKVAKKSRSLHALLLPVYASLEASSGPPGKHRPNLDLVSELHELSTYVKKAQEQVRDTLAGSPLVVADEYSQNMLVALDQVQDAAERLSKTL